MDLSIIILSYNTKQLLRDCLNSFVTDLPDGMEVIVVDNASTDSSSKLVEKEFPQIILIKSDKNLGYAAGNNLGIAKARGEYVMLLNSDTLTTPETFTTMVDFMRQHPRVGIASPKLLNSDNSIQQNGGALPTVLNILSLQFFLDEIPLITHLVQPYQQENQEFYLKSRKTGWISGAAMVIRRELLDRIEGLDENIFMYGEDVDLCWQARRAGYQVWTVAEARVKHLGQGSGTTTHAIVGEYRGMVYLAEKYLPKWRGLIRATLYWGAQLRQVIYKVIGQQQKYDSYRQAAQVVR